MLSALPVSCTASPGKVDLARSHPNCLGVKRREMLERSPDSIELTPHCVGREMGLQGSDVMWVCHVACGSRQVQAHGAGVQVCE